MADEPALRFAERVLALIDSGRKSATYKLATLLALIDVVAESYNAQVGAPAAVSGRSVASRVLELYWPQSAVFSPDHNGRPVTLRQSAQNDIVAKLFSWRTEHNVLDRSSLDRARMSAPAEWERLERDVVATVIRMPIPKLQRFGDGSATAEDRFIYDFGWPDEVAISKVHAASFDDTLHLRPGVGDWLVRLAPLLRPAIQTKWSQMVARQNSDVIDKHQLDEFLFGATRVDLSPIRAMLNDYQGGVCFYCQLPMRVAEVDHFLPWARHPDNTLDNLVAAHRQCNGAKSASLAAHEHLERWSARTADPTIGVLAAAAGWPRRRSRTLGTVAATYLWIPSGTRLWVHGATYEAAKPERIKELLAVA